MRNREKDEMEMAARREAMLDAGFRLFAERGIDAISMQDVAKACGLGVATLYRYYNTKLALVLDIGTRKWRDYVVFMNAYRQEHDADRMTAAEEFDFYLGFYFDLYRNHKDMLRFNQSYNNYVRHEGVAREQLLPYMDVIDEFRRAFSGIYAKALTDSTLRTDNPSDRMFTETSHIMLAVIVRYAQGLLYSAESESDRIAEFDLLRQMILREFRA